MPPEPKPESLRREVFAILFLYCAMAVPALLYGLTFARS